MEQKITRVSVGIEGYDEISYGGLLKGRVYLVCGNPGSGKTIFGLHFLTTGVNAGESVLFISMAEHEAQVKENAEILGFDTSGFNFLDLTPESDFFLEMKTYDIFSPAEVERQPTTDLIIQKVNQVKPARVFIDAMTQFRYLATDEFQFRKQVLSFLRFLRDQGATIVLTSEGTTQVPDDDLKFMCDGIIQMNYGDTGRTVTIVKSRGSDFKGGHHIMRITGEGIKIFPMLVPEAHHAEFVPSQISSGIPQLDEMLAGGIERGTISMITGPAGVGKTTLGLQFMKEAASIGIHSIIYTFEEDVATLVTRSEGIGIPLNQMIVDGLISVVNVEPLLYFPDEFANLVRKQVEEESVKVVMLDGTSGYRMSMQGGDLTRHLHALGKYLVNMGVTFILICETEYITGEFRATEMGISYLSDNLIFMRHYEFNGEVRRCIGVLKKRLTDHGKTLREFEITSEGLKVGQPLLGVQGILSGVPTILHENQ